MLPFEWDWTGCLNSRALISSSGRHIYTVCPELTERLQEMIPHYCLLVCHIDSGMALHMGCRLIGVMELFWTMLSGPNKLYYIIDSTNTLWHGEIMRKSSVINFIGLNEFLGFRFLPQSMVLAHWKCNCWGTSTLYLLLTKWNIALNNTMISWVGADVTWKNLSCG